MKILDQTVWINVDYQTWSGKKVLTRAEINKYSDAKKLPPQDLITPGSKSIADPEGLAKIQSFGKMVRRECEKVALKAFGLFGTSEEASVELITMLNDFKVKHDHMIREYLDNYEEETSAWIAKHPEWEQWLRSSMLSKEDIERRFIFDFQSFKLSSSGDTSLMNNGLKRVENGLLGTLLSEIEKAAKTAWDASYENKRRVTRRALLPIKAIRKKLDTLSYLDGKVLVLVQRIEDVLAALPKTGPIEGAALSSVCGLLNLLSCTKKMVAFFESAEQPLDSIDSDEADLLDLTSDLAITDAAVEINEIEIDDSDESNDDEELVSTIKQPVVQPAPAFGF